MGAFQMEKIVRQALAESANLNVDVSTIGLHQNLFDLGLKSFSCVQVLFALERALSLELPDELMRRETFMSIAAIMDALESARLSDPA